MKNRKRVLCIGIGYLGEDIRGISAYYEFIWERIDSSSQRKFWKLFLSPDPY